jgi:hypothetical protein
MALGSSGDAEAVYEIGRLTARICRAHGINFTLSPVVDINLNFKNPVTNIRAVSDDSERVYKIASAYSRGMRSEGKFATCAKHFPGDGVDDRNQHLCTSVNSLSMDEWWASYGSVYKRMIADGVDSIMIGHIALPAYGTESDEVGPYPASLSKRLITDLLKGELGFDGCVISDAMSMVGVAEKSVSLVRNIDGILPLNPKSVRRVLQINISYGKKNERMNTIPYLTAALEGQGCTVDFMTNPTHYRVDSVVDGYDAVIIGCDIHPSKCSGSSLSTDWNNIMAFWRGYALRNRRVVFISLGDPYKLYDLPFLRTYVNAYSNADTSVNAAVAAVFGKIPFKGRSPVRLEGFFERAD